ncbi:lactonase family protein [Diplocloster modestus]|uniref:Lactonase family protein n=1 Tax=Diplocloster modestus TaxID=2850322 RepID=A0ABS6KB49_9FIRM|nr:lactonase family protein [Diplocloster modestus]
MKENEVFMYVSSWAEHGGAPGLGLYVLNQEDGTIRFLEMIDERHSFNCAYVNQEKNKLYVNNEVLHFSGEPRLSGRIFVYDLDRKSGKARECMRVITGCPNPAYVNVNAAGTYLFEAHHSFPAAVVSYERNEKGRPKARMNYTEASIQVYRLNKEGLPGQLVENVNHADLAHGREAHPHCAVFSPSGKLMAVADKGDGYLYLYRFDARKRRLTLLSRTLTDREGASPRYVVFHPSKPYLFVNHEASYDGKCYVTAFSYRKDATVERICVENALDQSLPVKSGTRLEQQGFVIDQEGRYLYTLMNAADVIGVMEINQESGRLRLIQSMPMYGTRARGLAISPNGKFLLSAALVGGELASYEIGGDGTLRLACKGPAQPGAAYLTFYV